MNESNWSMVLTEAGSEPEETPLLERGQDTRLEILRSKWSTRHPDSEVSVVNQDGDLIYMGRYGEGVVIRLNGPDGPVTFLTNAMADLFGPLMAGRE